MPLISIIIPFYNVAPYIADCIHSITKQESGNYELVFVNDGSTDGSEQIFYSVMNRTKIAYQYMKQENKGLSEARNAGLKAAKGEFVCFVDSDDMLCDNALEVLNREISRHPDTDIFHYETAPLLFENGEIDENKVKYYSVDGDYDDLEDGPHLLARLVRNNSYVESANLLLIRRRWLEDNNLKFTPGALYEDSIFSIDCFMKCSAMRHIREGLYIYRVRSNSIMTSKKTFEQLKWRLWQYKEIIKRLLIAEDQELLQEALAQYAKLVLGSVKDTFSSLGEKDRSRICELEGAESLLLSSMRLEEDIENEKILLRGMLKMIEGAKNIVIYGCGNVGRKMLRLIESIGGQDKIKGFAVSANSEAKSFGNYPLMCIDAYKQNRVDLLIIASIRDHQVMKERTKEMDVENYLFVNATVEKLLDQYFAEDEK